MLIVSCDFVNDRADVVYLEERCVCIYQLKRVKIRYHVIRSR